MSGRADQTALERAARLEGMGVHVRSEELAALAKRRKELAALAKRRNEFFLNGGNRKMRRAAKKEKR